MRRWPSWTTAASDVLFGDREPSTACNYFSFRCQDDSRFALPFGPESKLSFCCFGLIKHFTFQAALPAGFGPGTFQEPRQKVNYSSCQSAQRNYWLNVCSCQTCPEFNVSERSVKEQSCSRVETPLMQPLACAVSQQPSPLRSLTWNVQTSRCVAGKETNTSTNG